MYELLFFPTRAINSHLSTKSHHFQQFQTLTFCRASSQICAISIRLCQFVLTPKSLVTWWTESYHWWTLIFWSQHVDICWTARSIAQIEVLFPTLLEKLFWWFQWSRGSNLWPNNTVNTKFCVKIFLGARMSQPPQNALYHTVQMVLVDPCDRLISRFS